MQPFIVAVGQSVKEIKSYFIVVEVLYKVKTCLAAIDLCFKTMIQLNAEYPVECDWVWALVQKAFYQLNSHMTNTTLLQEHYFRTWGFNKVVSTISFVHMYIVLDVQL